MKKTLMMAAVAALAANVGEARITGGTVTRVDLPEGVIADKSTVSPDGRFAVIAYGTGLSRVDLATGALSAIADVPSPFNVSISSDGKRVAYNTPSFDKNHRRYVAQRSTELGSGRTVVVAKPTRNIPVRYAPANSAVDASVGINYGHLELTVDGATRTLDPQGRGSYLWPAISPDGTKIVYYLATQGCFVCDIDGTNVRRIGGVRAAVWADNEHIIGMVDTDNDYTTIASYLVAVELDGNGVVLTPPDVVATYPSVAADGSMLTFTTPAGELYTLTLKRQ